LKNLLFVSHDATLTGAPILLLNLIRLIKEEDRYSVRVILKNGSGPLVGEFENTGELLIWKHEVKPDLLTRIGNRAAAKLGAQNANDKKIQRWIDESHAVISNTITNGDFLGAFNFSKAKLVFSYIHELEIATNFFTNPHDLGIVKTLTKRFMVPSAAVADHLMNMGIPGDKIYRLNYFIPFERSADIAPDSNTKFTVGLAGTLDWRKGADILSVIVASFFKKYPDANLVFKWRGAEKNSIEYQRIQYELEKINCLNKISFEAPSKDMNGFYQSIDILLLISKEDPYPLVVIEAASNKKACICFDKSGGAPEFVKNDAGTTIAYLDIEMLADTLLMYCNNKTMCLEKGAVAFNRYKSLHFNKELILQQFSAALN